MKTGWLIPVILLAGFINLSAQPLIGLGKEEVRVLMQKNREFRIDKTVTKQQFNYLKYVNNIQTKTFIIFFSDDDICTKTKLVCDYSEYEDMRDELNETRNRVGAASWEYSYDGSTYTIAMEEQEWYFVLRETEKTEKND